MSQLSLNQTIQSRETDPDSFQRKGIFKNSENYPKKRPNSALTSKAGNDDTSSINTINTGGDFTRVHKLGYIPTYLKKQTKSSVESELVNKYRKFKIAKKELVEKQSNLMKDFEHLRVLRGKLKQFGGRDFKLETMGVIEFTGGSGNDDGGGGDAERLTESFGDCANSGSNSGHMVDFQCEIQRIRSRVKDCLFKLIELNAEALKYVKLSGSEELQEKIRDIFAKVEEHVRSVNTEQDASIQLLLDKLQQIKNAVPKETKSSKDEVVGLRKNIQNLEVQKKMLQSEIDVKNREIEYLKNKEMAYSKNTNSDTANIDTNQCELLESKIQSQKDLINDYQMKLDERAKQQDILEGKVCQLEEKIYQQNRQMEENQLKFENGLSGERKKYKELENLLEETKDANSRILKTNDSSFEQISNQLAAANEDIKELHFKIGKRDKQIQNLKQAIDSGSSKFKNYDELLVKYDDLWQQDQLKSKEMHQLKEKLMARTDTVNSQLLVISDLKNKLMAQIGSGAEGKSTGALHDEQASKFFDHERIIKKLESNKIRSNLLRDQLLDRISSLEKENIDMKAQIRKFHEDFTINRFMHDEQRRKKRLTEILVKQYQK